MKNRDLLLALFLLAMPLVASAYDFEVDGIYYEINEDGKTVVVTYGGSYSGDVVIPSTVTFTFTYNETATTYSVTSIGNRAFDGCTDLTSITIPNSVTIIGDYAFRSCTDLTSITIPNSVTIIGDYAFSSCTDLTSVTIGNGVTSIGNSVFYGCTGLTSITIPNSVTSIGQSAFRDCSGLTSITIPNSVTSIGSHTFDDCIGLTSVTIGNSVTSIGSYAFCNCIELTAVYITDIVAWCNIDFDYQGNPLYYAENLYLNGNLVTDLIIPEKVTEIKNFVFHGCGSLTSVTVGNSVISIGDSAFSNCIGLTSVTIDNSVKSIGENAFMTCISLTSVTIGNGVTSIGQTAFSNCIDLTSVTIGNSITSIEKDAFYNCIGLTAVYITDIAAWCNIDFDFGSNPLQYAKNLYLNGNLVTDLIIPEKVTEIKNRVFYGYDGLTSVTIGNIVTRIGDYAFYDCSKLASIIIGNRVKSIGDYAFYGCLALSEIDCEAIIPPVCNESVFSPETYKKAILYVPKSSQTDYAATNPWLKFMNIKILINTTDFYFNILSEVERTCEITYGENKYTGDIVIPSEIVYNGTFYTVKAIGEWAFGNCNELTSVEIPYTVTTIGDNAFYGCLHLTNITVDKDNQYYTSVDGVLYNKDVTTLVRCPSAKSNVTIPHTVTTIGNFAFESCISLPTIKLPNSVTIIGRSAFYNCTSLTSVVMGDAVTGIDDFAFEGCTSLATIELPGVIVMGRSVFYNCTSLTSVGMGDAITVIGDWAFEACTSLSTIAFPASVAEIGKGSFIDCWALTDITVDKDNQYYTSIDGVLYNKDVTSLVCCPAGKSEVDIPETITAIEYAAFHDCSYLTTIKIPSAVTTIGDYAFYDCPSFTEIYCMATTPPVCGTEVFVVEPYERATLYVPLGCKADYKVADTWMNFAHIEERDFAGIESINTQNITVSRHGNNIVVNGVDGATTIEVYDMQGVLVYRGFDATISLPTHGAYLVCVAGKSYKVVI